MRRQVIFDVEARTEFEDAVEWYNNHEPGLGDRFADEIQSTIRRILKDPEQFTLAGRVVRRAPVKKFTKYSVLFHIEPDFIGVDAVFHGARNPARLRGRLK